ncbi:MAG: aminomethyltransferase [Dehalococcoidia bacterium]|nr:aminomethyltransferase [Dehalococcoidia bacterium]
MAKRKNLTQSPVRQGNRIDCSREIKFSYNGRWYQGYKGDTVASALFAAGKRIFSRSFKYHRPRGLTCVSGQCPNCLMTVDGVPNVRSCIQPLSQGMQVEHQNAWPSLEHDIFGMIDRLGKFLPVGFYYKSLIRPKLLWKIAEPFIRRMAGLGKVNLKLEHGNEYNHRFLHTDIAIVGGGLAGLTATVEAIKADADIILVEEQPCLGGTLRHRAQDIDFPELPGLSAQEVADKLAETVVSSSSVSVMTNASAIGLYEGNYLGVRQGNELVKIRAKQVIITTGSYQIPLVFDNNDLPGVMLGDAVRKLIHYYGVSPGNKAVVVTSDDNGHGLAKDLAEAGVEVIAIADNRPKPDIDHSGVLENPRVPVFWDTSISRALGKKHVRGIEIVTSKEASEYQAPLKLKCDLICISTNSQPANSLLHQTGATIEYDKHTAQPLVKNTPAGVFAAGEVTGIHDKNLNVLQAKVAALKSCQNLGILRRKKQLESLIDELEQLEITSRSLPRVHCSQTVPGISDKRIVCYCEDVLEKDLNQAIEEGFRDIQILKRYSTVTMGPCQGKMCSAAAIDICARATGTDISQIGTTTSRPPLEPVSLGVLAGSVHTPLKRTPMHNRHVNLGAKMVQVGEWLRPHSYGNVWSEYQAVRERVGVIDVSTLGKLDLKGDEAAPLLDRLYVNRIGNLKVGRTRYGVVCSETGVILDDGTISRLAEDHFFVTTTTGNTESMESWFKWWSASTNDCVHITNITAGMGAVNLAGPFARDVLSKLSPIDLSNEVFGYMGNVSGLVAGVPATLMRIGFVGETGWEIHFPSEYGEYLWDSIIQAGQEFGIRPFGVEAQRILRLEKKHVIIGQDTDALTNPYEANMAWAVKLEKEDFVGRGGLRKIKGLPRSNKLVGFVMKDGTVPRDGDPVIDKGVAVGRVTSARYSPHVGRGFGLAYLPDYLAVQQSDFTIAVNGLESLAVIVDQAFYDPEGLRLRG